MVRYTYIACFICGTALKIYEPNEKINLQCTVFYVTHPNKSTFMMPMQTYQIGRKEGSHNSPHTNTTSSDAYCKISDSVIDQIAVVESSFYFNTACLYLHQS